MLRLNIGLYSYCVNVSALRLCCLARLFSVGYRKTSIKRRVPNNRRVSIKRRVSNKRPSLLESRYTELSRLPAIH